MPRSLSTLMFAQIVAVLGTFGAVLALLAADAAPARNRPAWSGPSMSGIERIKPLLAVQVESLAKLY